MASFNRQCRDCCDRAGYDSGCSKCGGAGIIVRPIKIPVNLRIHSNGLPEPFTMIVHKDGTIQFRKKKHRSTVATSVQSTFDKARMETATDTLKNKPARKRKVSRGLLRGTR